LSAELILARIMLLLVQAGLALALSYTLWHFYRIYQRHHLKSWAVGFLLFGCYLLALNLYSMVPAEYQLIHFALEFTHIFCHYSFAIWILLGVREAVSGERIAVRLVNRLHLVLLCLSLISVLLFVGEPTNNIWQQMVQTNLRLLFIGAALLVAGSWLMNLPRQLMVIRLVAWAVKLWGVQMVLLSLLISYLDNSGPLLQAVLVSKHLELLLQTVLGLGLVLWLQEDERHTNQQLTEKTLYLDSHDQLTGALNRDGLLAQLSDLLAQQQPLVLVMLGLDKFKRVNETVGLKHGDRILREVTRRFEASVLKPRFVARTGGDIFALALQDIQTEKQRQFCVNHLEQLIEKPFNFDSGMLKLTATMGFAQYPDHAASAESLLQKANIAFHQAKRQQLRWVQYLPGMEEETARMLLLEKELQQALAEKQFELFYQPQWHLRDQRIEGFEALVRWHHPNRGLLMPGQFLPEMERLGLMRELDFLLLEQAVSTLGRWRSRQLDLSVAVNMSPIHFEQPGLKQKIQQLLQQYNVSPTMLELEITENTAMGDMEQGRNYVSELQQMGIRVSIDDFGTGYSSLGYLRRMPIDKIKIDRSFIMDMAGSDSDMMIVKTMITLAHGLGKRILAEGVEDLHQLHLLKRMGCDTAQGYLLSKPLPEAEALVLAKQPLAF